MDITLYILTGAAAGFLAGLLGIGGGLVVVPALILIFERTGLHDQAVAHVAIATSLATIVVTGAVATWAHHRQDAVDWSLWSRLAPGLAVGAALGAALAQTLPDAGLRILFGLFLVAVAARMAWGKQSPPSGAPPATGALLGAGAGVGLLSALLGIGGGTLTVPLLTWRRVPMHMAIATSAAGGVVIALVAATLLAAANAAGVEGTIGYVDAAAFTGVAAGSVICAPIGAWLAHRLPVASLRRVFALVLVVVAVRLLLSG